MRFVLALIVFAAVAPAQKPVFPPGVKPVGPYSPGLVVGDLLYVSGQGARDAKGQLPASADEQVRQTLENVKTVVEAAGLTMQHVVSAQAYLADMKNYDALNRVWAKYFPKDPPARSTIGVTRMPTDTPVEIAVVAVRDLRRKKTIQYPGRTMPVPISAAVTIGDRVYFTGQLGRDPDAGRVPSEPRKQMEFVARSAEAILKAAGLEIRHLSYVNIYVTPAMPMKVLADLIDEFIPSETARTVIQTASLPFGANVEVAGIASRDAKRRGNCSSIGKTMYCSGRAGTTRQVLESLQADLAVNGSSLSEVIASNVYLDSIDQFAAMNAVYATYFKKAPPTRTTVQPWKEVVELSLPPLTGVAAQPDDSPRAQMSLIAVRP